MTPMIGSAAVPRIARAVGRVRGPGDKSNPPRSAMLAALADGTSRLTGYAPGADCAATLACIAALGVRVSRPRESEPAAIDIEGLGGGGFRPPAPPPAAPHLR